MSAITKFAADVEAFKTRLGTDASHLLSDFETLISKLTGQAETDAADVAAQAEGAAGPVIAAAETDASKLAAEAVAGVEQAVTPTTPSA